MAWSARCKTPFSRGWSGDRVEAAHQTLTSPDRVDLEIARQLLFAPAVQHLLEHGIGRYSHLTYRQPDQFTAAIIAHEAPKSLCNLCMQNAENANHGEPSIGIAGIMQVLDAPQNAEPERLAQSVDAGSQLPAIAAGLRPKGRRGALMIRGVLFSRICD